MQVQWKLVGLARAICIYGVCTVFLAGESPIIWSYTVCVHLPCYIYAGIRAWGAWNVCRDQGVGAWNASYITYVKKPYVDAWEICRDQGVGAWNVCRGQDVDAWNIC